LEPNDQRPTTKSLLLRLKRGKADADFLQNHLSIALVTATLLTSQELQLDMATMEQSTSVPWQLYSEDYHSL
jgi:hypothetical protein